MPDGSSPRWKKGGTMLPRKSVIKTIPAIKTHHAAISLDFNISQNHIKGPGYWKVNCSLLDDENYRKEPRLRLKCLSGRPSADVICRITDVFGIGLSQYKLRAHAVQFSKSKAKRKAKEKKKDKENILKDEFNNAKKTFECDPTNNCKHFNTAKEKLEHFCEEKLQSIIIRARARRCEHGEKSTKYFLNLEKRNHVKKHVRKLKINGSDFFLFHYVQEAPGQHTANRKPQS